MSLESRMFNFGSYSIILTRPLIRRNFISNTLPYVIEMSYLIEALKIRQLRLPESEKVAVTHEKIGSLARGMGKAKKAQIAFEGKNRTANV